MKATVEISNYPLTEAFEPIISDFIHRCQQSSLTVRVNATSTHIQGDYDQVMEVIKAEIKTSFENYGKMIFVVKVLKGELNLDLQM